MLLPALYIVFVFICLLLVGAVLLQTGRGGGMAGLGGGMADNVFGAHTTNVLQKFTFGCVALFFLLVIIISRMESSILNSGISLEGAIQTTESSKIETTPAQTKVTEAPVAPAVKAEVPVAPVAPVAPAVKAETPVAPVVPAVKAETPVAPVAPAVKAEAPVAPVAPAVKAESATTAPSAPNPTPAK